MSVGSARLTPSAVRVAGLVVSLASTAVVLAIVLRGGWRELARPLASGHVEWLLAALALALAVEVAKAVRWQVLLGVRFRRLPETLAVIFAARLLNALAPLRAGDVWRVTFAARAQERHIVAAGGSVVAEKVCDGLALGALALLVLGSFGPLVQGLALAAAVGGACAALVAAGRYPSAGSRITRWLAELRHLRDRRVVAGAVLCTVAALGLGLLVNATVLRALDLQAAPVAAALMLLAGYAVGVLPTAPGQIGVYELAVSAPLVVLGYTPGEALLGAIGLHLVLLTSLAAGGLLAVPLGLSTRARRHSPAATDSSYSVSAEV